ncbi:VCBS repeat-containing protein [Arenibacter sp. GZD96]|uniref:VCBS repeat-containing protein n=1 Tax=Aurantibrevibacter litoralis TaxID=3106030 RepID=UPI002AFDD89C|nr:VCBS repeat-containing protein [Arenibacter sp. GZD-96]MEA1786217.1 VCBS repeat-containing protein [Arenibacter sp. GZD-96]
MFRSIAFIVVLVLAGCAKQEPKSPVFAKISSATSGLDFSNTITETDVLNILDYEYLYNGGGVGIGDFNSDGLPDLCFSGNMVPSRIYINLGNLKFKDITESSGFITDKWCTGISIVDINNDGKPDIYVSTAHDLALGDSENYFFINKTDANGQVKFENLAKEMNLAATSYTMQAVWLDFDQDGLLDVFLANNSKEAYPKNNPFGQRKDGRGKSTDRLYRNKGLNANGIPEFEDVSAAAGIAIEGWSLGVTVVDLNNDQFPDIYVANDFMSNDLLYINNRDGTFTNKITQYFKHQSHNSMGVDVADINNDAMLDFLVLDMLPEDNLRKKTMFSDIPFDRFKSSLNVGYQPQFVRNVLQINTSSGFSDLGYFSGVAATDWSWSPLIADFDNNGLRDIYITNGYKKDITDMDFVDFNNANSFYGSPEEKRNQLVAQLQQMEGVKKSNFYFKNIGENRFLNSTETMGLSYPSYSNGAVYADLDVDGDLDLIINNIDNEVLLFENQTTSLNPKANYLRVSFEPNANSLGAKVCVYAQTETLYAEFYPQRGYLSSVEPVLHFGLGSKSQIDSVHIVWPDTTENWLYDLAINETIDPVKSGNIFKKNDKTAPGTTYFETIESSQKIPYVHTESSFDDFKRWPLFFRGYSRPGPVLISGDINGDQLEDIFIAGTANNDGLFYVQKKDGTFEEKGLASVGLAQQAETSAAMLFDADGDGDLDLYCANGSSEYYANRALYQDNLYLNDGQGNFYYSPKSLPEITFPTHTVVPIDIDNDGDLDLFVGGRLDPNNYPFSPRSYLLRNDNGVFTDVTASIAPALRNPGMVTDAVSVDIDQDGWQDLMIVGEWMPLQIYYNKKGTFQSETNKNGLEFSNGWWNCIVATDFDNDGDTDFVVGNWGLNNPFSASPTAPLTLYAKDYDQNGSIEPLMTYILDDKEYLMHPKGTLEKQLPLVRRIAKSYKAYGSSTFKQLFSEFDFDKNELFKTYQLASVYVENLGNGHFKLSPLPHESQWAPIFDFEVIDINNDTKPDVLAVGNYYGSEVLTGYYNAGNGVALLNDGAGEFSFINSTKSGFSVPEEARKIIKIKHKETEALLLIGLQNDSLKMYRKRR